jgi:hypothetical protein
MKSRIIDVAIDYASGEGKITLKVAKNDLKWYEGLKDKELDVEIKEHKEKRSLNANAYCWVLIQQIADAIRSTKEEVYKKFIREKGIFRTAEIDNKALNTLMYLWQDKGLGWVVDIVEKKENSTEVILYYGTSSYNTKQMSNFIDYIVDSAKEMGIQVLSPEELILLKENWK